MEIASSQISEDEIIQNQYHLDKFSYITTNKRLIRHRSDEFEDLGYKHIISVRLKQTTNMRLTIFGIFLLLIGVTSFLYIPGSYVISMIFSISGIMLIIAGILSKDRYTEIIAPGLIWKEEGKAGNRLIKDIREHMKKE